MEARRDRVGCRCVWKVTMWSPRVQSARRWYAVYCFLNAGLYLVVVGFLVWAIGERDRVGAPMAELVDDPGAFVGQVSGLLAVMFAMFAGVCLYLPFSKRNKTWFVIHFVNVMLGLGSCVFTPLCLYLGWAMLQADVRGWFDGSGKSTDDVH